MNARVQQFDVTVEGRQIVETVSSIFSTLLLHRTLGKFHYKAEGSYSIGTVGVEDCDCDYFDLTYVRVNSEELNRSLTQEIAGFSESLRQNEGQKNGQISLEFYQKRRRTPWLFSEDSVPWEIWTLNIDVISLNNESERLKLRETVGDSVAEVILNICCCMNKQQYVPKMPVHSELNLVFETRFSDVQPYLYKINHRTTGPSTPSMGSLVKKVIRDTLSY